MGPEQAENMATIYEPPVDYLLISTPNLLVASRIRVQLEVAGIRTAESALGLEVWCRSMDHKRVLESVGLMLSPLERHDTRIATVRLGEDVSELHRSIFRAKALDRVLHELNETWFEAVLAEGRIAIHFQPIVQYPPGRVHGYECLMRGVDLEGNLISPARMFEAASTLDKRRQLDERCRIAAIRAAAALNDRDLRFFINFIPSTIADPQRCLSETLQEVRDAGLRPDQIAFEVVETDRVYDKRHLINVLRCFRKAGFHVALDDVGAGYSSLLSLSYLRPDYIKIDGELVRRAAYTTLEAKMVADLAETARQNGIITIAEGIETVRELSIILDAGIRMTQGYYHARPQAQPLDQKQARAIADRLDALAQARRPGLRL